MSTEAIAIWLSAFSVGMAGLSLGWNIYRDVILKPKVRVDLGVRTLISDALPDRPRKVTITLTNMGPGIVHIAMIQIKEAQLWRRILRKVKYAAVIHDYEEILSAQLPAKIEMGNKIDLLLPYNEESFLADPYTHVGVWDYYGRSHWAAERQVKEARKRWISDFGKTDT